MKAFDARASSAATSPRPDFAVYVEPTRLDVYPAQIGFFIADIDVTGTLGLFRRAGARRMTR